MAFPFLFVLPSHPVHQDKLEELRARMQELNVRSCAYWLAEAEAREDDAFVGECEAWRHAMRPGDFDEVLKSCEVWLNSLTPARYRVANEIIDPYGYNPPCMCGDCYEIASPFDEEYDHLRGLFSSEMARRRLEESEEDADDDFRDDHALLLAEAFSPTVVA